MLKNERMIKILDAVNDGGVVTVGELVKKLDVSSMTIRRDLDELEKQEKIIRVFGGAQSVSLVSKSEPSYIQKRRIHINEKNEIAKKAAEMIESDETIFIGPGSTNELISKYIDVSNLRIVTNSLPVFERFKDEHDYELVLVGGIYRERSGAFVGSLALDFLKGIKMHKAFVGANGVMGNSVMNANPEEGMTQQMALDQSQEKYVLADHNKLDHDDFYHFYDLSNVTGLIVDHLTDRDIVDRSSQLTRVFVSKKKN